MTADTSHAVATVPTAHASRYLQQLCKHWSHKLPVEFDASRRALVWMESSGIASSIEHDRAKKALFWAAMTYVAAAIGSLAQLMYFLMMALGRRN